MNRGGTAVRRAALAAAAAAAVALAGAAPAQALRVEKLRVMRPAGMDAGEIEVVAEEALVRFDVSTSSSARAAVMASIGGSVIRELESVGWTKVALPGGMPVGVGLNLLKALPGVLEVEPNHVYRPTKIPNDPLFWSQYHHAKINSAAGWEFEVGDSSPVTIAILDSGIDGTHSDISSKLVGTSKDCTGGGCVDNQPPTEACDHATGVSGVAAAATGNGEGGAGVSWNAQLLSMKIFDGACAGDDAYLIDALNYIDDPQIQNSPTYGQIVANLSIGGCNASCPAPIQTAINLATNAGVVVVVSAGNYGPGTQCDFSSVQYPGNCDNVIVVGATDENDGIASFSARGPEMSSNGVVAPGKNILTAASGSGYTTKNGTSFSAPIVSGLAALILSRRTDLFQSDPTQVTAGVKSILRQSADGIGISSLGMASGVRPMGQTAGAGRVNAFRAMRLAVRGTLAGFAGDEKVIAFPNPFRASDGVTTITIPTGLQGGNADIRIYTMDGVLVRELKALTAWDGKNDHGKRVATGTYIILVKTDAGTQSARVALIR